MKSIRIKRCLISSLCGLLIVGCDGNNTNDGTKVSDAELVEIKQLNQVSPVDEFSFGFDLRSSPQEDARQYLPFLKYLEKKTGYKFKLRFTPSNSDIADDLGNGTVNFAAIGAVSYINAAAKYNVIPLVRGINLHGQAKYRSMLIVRPNSIIKKLSDIKGVRFAFGGITSTQGHLIPRIILSKNNLNLSSFASYEYTGSHQKCADAIISGRFDVCALQDTMARELEQQRKVRILYKSDYYPSSGVAANKNVKKEVLDAVISAMLDFKPNGKDKMGLYHWGKTEMPNGFSKADAGDYSELQNWLQKLGLLKVNNAFNVIGETSRNK